MYRNEIHLDIFIGNRQHVSRLDFNQAKNFRAFRMVDFFYYFTHAFEHRVTVDMRIGFEHFWVVTSRVRRSVLLKYFHL